VADIKIIELKISASVTGALPSYLQSGRTASRQSSAG